MANANTDILTHRPLPYVVVVRTVTDDDAPPQTSVIRVRAYSILEAMIQATTNLSGGYRVGSDSKAEIISIEPDMPAFFAQAAEDLATAKAAAR
jgi:hypothetical protein